MRGIKEGAPYGYLVLLFLLVGGVLIYPLFYGIQLAFLDRNLLRPASGQFVGLQNFRRLFFEDELFFQCLRNSLIFTFASVGFEYLLGLSSALLLNSRFIKLRNMLRAIILLPWVVPIAVNSLNWRWMLAPRYGIINQLLVTIGLEKYAINWLSDLSAALPAVIFVNVWRSFPFYTITIGAGLTLIPAELYEAAKVDGASKWQLFKYITLPGIRTVSIVIVTLHIIWTFVNFDMIYILTGGGPLYQTEVLPTYLYQQAFRFFRMSYAASIGVFILLFLIATTGFYFTRVSKLYGD